MFKKVLMGLLMAGGLCLGRCDAGFVTMTYGSIGLTGGGPNLANNALTVIVDDVTDTVKVDFTNGPAGAVLKIIGFNTSSTPITGVVGTPLQQWSWNQNNISVTSITGFDLLLDFQPPGLDAGTMATYSVTPIGNAQDFMNLTEATNAQSVRYMSAAHIGGFAGGVSGTYGVTSSSYTPSNAENIVPEPATIGLLFAGLACSVFGGKSLRRRTLA